MSRTFNTGGIPLLNSQLHPSMFQTGLPPQPELRTLDSVMSQQTIPIDTTVERNNFRLHTVGKPQANYAHEMLRGRLDPTPVAIAFFSYRNLKALQNNLRHLVKQRTGYDIDEQDENIIKVTQATMFYQYGLHQKLSRDPQKAAQQIAAAVKRLNLYVLQDILPQTISGVEQYIGYLRDSSQNPVPLEQPKSMSVTGTRRLRAMSDIILANPYEERDYMNEN